MTDGVYVNNGRRDYQRILIAVTAAAWGVLVIAGAGWVSSIQSQVTTTAAIQSQRGERITAVETRLQFLVAEIADLKVRTQQLERELTMGSRK